MAPETTGFLYPFIEADERNAGSSPLTSRPWRTRKPPEVVDLRRTTLESLATDIDEIAAEMAHRFDNGGRLFTFGNGGNQTDATSVVALFSRRSAGRALATRSLVADQATITALGNDVGFDLVFSRQLIAYGRPGDIAMGFSASGNSANLSQLSERHAVVGF